MSASLRTVRNSHRDHSRRRSLSRSARNGARKREDFAMLDFAYGFLMRSEEMIPAAVFVATVIWFARAKRKFAMRQSAEPFNVRDMRTWPLWFVVVDTTLFVAVFAAVTAALGEGGYTYAIGGGVAAFLTFGLAPAILTKMRK
jgi:hypothetical protein